MNSLSLKLLWIPEFQITLVLCEFASYQIKNFSQELNIFFFKINLATIIQRRYVIYDFSFSNNKHFCVTWLMIFLVPPVFFIFLGYFVFVIISSAYWNFQFLIFSNIMGLSLEEMLKNLWIGQTSVFVYLLLLSLSSYNTIFGRITSKHGWGKNNSRIPLRF